METLRSIGEYEFCLPGYRVRDMDVFFDTEEAHAGMLANGANEGGRAAPKVTPTSLNREICSGDGRPPGSAGGSRLKATAQFGAKKDIHSPSDNIVWELGRQSQLIIKPYSRRDQGIPDVGLTGMFLILPGLFSIVLRFRKEDSVVY